jgi:hypothetical protein
MVVGAAVVGAAVVGAVVVGRMAVPIVVVVGMSPRRASLVTAGGLEQLVAMATPTTAARKTGATRAPRLTRIGCPPRSAP